MQLVSVQTTKVGNQHALCFDINKLYLLLMFFRELTPRMKTQKSKENELEHMLRMKSHLLKEQQRKMKKMQNIVLQKQLLLIRIKVKNLQLEAQILREEGKRAKGQKGKCQKKE